MSVLHQKIENYFKDQKEVIAVYLFGSYATGKERSFSDVDIGILFDEIDQEMSFEKRKKYLVELGRILRKDIHPVILNTASETLLRQVFSKGECLLVRDEKKHVYRKMQMFVNMAEFGYYRNQIRSGLIKSIMEGRDHG